MNFRKQLIILAHIFIINFSASALVEVKHIEGIEQSPLILSNHELNHNALQESVYELLNKAQSSILIFSFTFSDSKVIQIINKKARDGINVQLVVDRDHMQECKRQLDSSIKLSGRTHGEGHMHHKILVVDHQYVWLGSGNFTPGSFTLNKNIAIGFANKDIADQLHQEAQSIILSDKRTGLMPLSCSYGNQLLQLYILPHNDPEHPCTMETQMNELGKQKLMDLINNAKHHLKISVDVWTYKDASRAIINALQRGVQVDIMVGDISGEAVKMMIQAKVNVKQVKNLHYKFMLVDHTIFLNGSLNWSMNAFSRSDESFIVLYDLTQEQLNVLEGSLKAAGLPTGMHINKIEQSNNVLIDVFIDEEANTNAQLVNKTIKALNDQINTSPTSQEHERLIALAKRLSSDLVKFTTMKNGSVPGCCLYDGDNYLFNVVTIAEKQERVEAALRYIKNEVGIDQKVIDYFQKTLQNLKLGTNVPLPDYFHATREGLKNIIESKTILQSQTGFTGKGTYVSCNNEGNYGYGSHTFAIDEHCLIDTQAIFRTGRHPLTNVFFSLWASVLKNIPVSEETIAFIDTSVNDIEYVKELVEKQHLNIEVVSRETAEMILKVFDKVTHRRELPSFFWKKHNVKDYLPQNMYPRSQQGTFRQFLFN